MSHNAPVRNPLDLSMGRFKFKILETIRSGNAQDLLSSSQAGGTFERFILYLESHQQIAEEIPLLHALQCWVEQRLKDYNMESELTLAGDCINIGVVFSTVNRIPEAIEWLWQAEQCVVAKRKSLRKNTQAREIITRIYLEKARCYQMLGEIQMALSFEAKAHQYRHGFKRPIQKLRQSLSVKAGCPRRDSVHVEADS